MPDALYECTICNERYTLTVPMLMPTIVLGHTALGNAPHGPKKDCRCKVFDLVEND